MSNLKTKLTTWWSRVRGQDQSIENPPARLTRTQRDQAIHSLQEGYHELLDLMSAVRIHLDKQSDRSDRMLELMQHLPDALKALPETNRNQARMLEAIEEHLEDQRRAGKEMNESMSGLATSADRQVQIMTAMHQQFDSRTETDQQMAKSLGSLNGALQNLNTSSEASLRFLSELAERNDRTQRELSSIVQKNRRHTTILAGTSCAILVLGIAAIAMGFFSSDPQPTPTAPAVTQSETTAPDTETRIETIATPAAEPADADDLLHGFDQPAADASEEISDDVEPQTASEPATDTDLTGETDTDAAPQENDSQPPTATDPAPADTTDADIDAGAASLPLPIDPTAVSDDGAGTRPFDPTGLADFQWLESEPDAPVTLTPAVIETD